jgi:hypothetical protein
MTNLLTVIVNGPYDRDVGCKNPAVLCSPAIVSGNFISIVTVS